MNVHDILGRGRPWGKEEIFGLIPIIRIWIWIIDGFQPNFVEWHIFGQGPVG